MYNSNLKNILIDYDKKRQNAIHLAYKKKEQLYKEYPKLQNLEDEISREAIKTSKLLLSSNDVSLLDELNKKIDLLRNEKRTFLSSIGMSEIDLKPIFECSICEDTGYVTTNNFQTIMCNCLKQKLFDLEYNKSNIFNLKNQTFEQFNSTYYSSSVDEKKYNSKLSPRENIELIKKISLNFVNSFDDPNENNLLFSGSTGLGKSFLSSCIANELLKKGKTVLYQTAPVMLDTIVDYRFGKPNAPANLYENILNVDLLIIDDLGTEAMNSIKFSELFNILNTRLLNCNQKITKTIISTNLSLQNLLVNYDERIVSRIVGNFTVCYFYGDDIRFLKKIS